MKNDKLKQALFIIFIVAIFLRLLVVFGQKDIRPENDAKEYDEMGINIASGNGFSLFVNGSIRPVAYRAPVYPLFLASIYSIFGHSHVAAKIGQAVIGALLCLIIFYITYIIYGDIVMGLMASAFTALYKPFISGFFYYGGPAILLTECFYMFILGLTLLITIRFIKDGDMKIGVLAGIFMGLAILTRAEFVLFPILLGVYLFHITRFSIKEFFKKYFVIYLFIALTMSPWVIRNHLVYKEFIPLTTLSGEAFLIGNNSLARGGWAWPEDYTAINRDMYRSDNQKSKKYFKIAIKTLMDNPRRIPKLFIKKILVHWAPFEEGFKIFNPSYAFIFMFGSIGILFFRKRLILEYILLITLLSTTLTAMLTFGEPRVRYPYEPYLIIFTALTIREVIKKIKG